MLAASISQIRLWCTQVVPVCLRLHPTTLNGHWLAFDIEQPLEDTFGLFVAALAEVVIADDAVPVDEVERRPVVVLEGAPDLVVVVDRDRVVDPSLDGRPPDKVDLVLKRELRRVDSNDHQPVVAVRPGPRPGRTARCAAS